MKFNLKNVLFATISLILISGAWYIYSLRNVGSHFVGGETYFFEQSEDSIITALKTLKHQYYQLENSQGCGSNMFNDGPYSKTNSVFCIYLNYPIDGNNTVHECIVYQTYENKTGIIYSAIFENSCHYKNLDHDIGYLKRKKLTNEFEKLVINKIRE